MGMGSRVSNKISIEKGESMNSKMTGQSHTQDILYVDSLLDPTIRAEEVERLVSSSLVSEEGDDIDPEMFRLLKAMDIFSVGCVIAELFMDGGHLFDLSALLKYKTGTYDPKPR